MTYQWKWQPQDSLTSSGYVSGAAAGPLPEDPAVYSSSSSRSTSTSRGLLQITQPDILATLVQDLWCKGAGKMFGGALAGFVLFVARGEGPFHVSRVTRQRVYTDVIITTTSIVASHSLPNTTHYLTDVEAYHTTICGSWPFSTASQARASSRLSLYLLPRTSWAFHRPVSE